MQLDNRRVEAAWLKQLSDKFGSKLKNNKGVLTLDGVIIEEIAPNPIRVISKVDATPTGTTVWWSIDLGNAYLGKDATPVQWKSAEKYLKDFARMMYREDLGIADCRSRARWLTRRTTTWPSSRSQHHQEGHREEQGPQA